MTASWHVSPNMSTNYIIVLSHYTLTIFTEHWFDFPVLSFECLSSFKLLVLLLLLLLPHPHYSKSGALQCSLLTLNYLVISFTHKKWSVFLMTFNIFFFLWVDFPFSVTDFVLKCVGPMHEHTPAHSNVFCWCWSKSVHACTDTLQITWAAMN